MDSKEFWSKYQKLIKYLDKHKIVYSDSAFEDTGILEFSSPAQWASAIVLFHNIFGAGWTQRGTYEYMDSDGQRYMLQSYVSDDMIFEITLQWAIPENQVAIDPRKLKHQKPNTIRRKRQWP